VKNCKVMSGLCFVSFGFFFILDRRRREFSKFTILLNNMRLMAILDWWEAVKDFIMENIESPYGG
jgi:vacuolar protein sorting-associated protein 13D